MEVPETEVGEIKIALVKLEESVKALIAVVSEMRVQMASYNISGHRDTPLHCEQIRRAEADIAALKTEIEAAKERDRAMLTRIAIIATVITLGGGAGVNLIMKAIM